MLVAGKKKQQYKGQRVHTTCRIIRSHKRKPAEIYAHNTVQLIAPTRDKKRSSSGTRNVFLDPTWRLDALGLN